MSGSCVAMGSDSCRWAMFVMVKTGHNSNANQEWKGQKKKKTHHKYDTFIQRNYTAVNVNCYVHRYGWFSAGEEEPSPRGSIHYNSKPGMKNGIG